MVMRFLSPRRVAQLEAFDRWTDNAMEPLRGNPVADRMFYTASAVGDHGLLWMGVALIRSLITRDRFRGFLVLSVVLAVESILVNGVIKSIFRRQRPDWDQDRPMHLRKPLTSSFPSGHAASAFCCAVLLADGSRLGPIYYVAAAIVALSRVHVRIHHGSDVAAGIITGWAMGVVARHLAPLG